MLLNTKQHIKKTLMTGLLYNTQKQNVTARISKTCKK